ncbi:hypothetical protein PsorP6_002518 [Peronosclerospora sorghi]|uniref:Uncharacterized protein n=1 Tax=Peronosclerospora sorghi TaxID=230839 RepID=A0ACC0WSE1_9STRA|nr:hypothetical protein PsorP6_002518 [Peronosclerospora sorghi]
MASADDAAAANPEPTPPTPMVPAEQSAASSTPTRSPSARKAKKSPASTKEESASKETAKTKKLKARKAPKKASESGLSYFELIVDAVKELKDRNGSSRQAISKVVETKKHNYASHHLNKALRSAVESGKLIQIKGSYKLSAEVRKPAASMKKGKKVSGGASAKVVKKAGKVTKKVPTSKKAAAKKVASKKVAAKKTPSKKTPAKKVTVKTKAASKKVAAKKTGNKKTTAKVTKKTVKMAKNNISSGAFYSEALSTTSVTVELITTPAAMRIFQTHPSLSLPGTRTDAKEAICGIDNSQEPNATLDTQVLIMLQLLLIKKAHVRFAARVGFLEFIAQGSSCSVNCAGPRFCRGSIRASYSCLIYADPALDDALEKLPVEICRGNTPTTASF